MQRLQYLLRFKRSQNSDKQLVWLKIGRKQTLLEPL
jgi:hypothetical protein